MSKYLSRFESIECMLHVSPHQRFPKRSSYCFGLPDIISNSKMFLTKSNISYTYTCQVPECNNQVLILYVCICSPRALRHSLSPKESIPIATIT